LLSNVVDLQAIITVAVAEFMLDKLAPGKEFIIYGICVLHLEVIEFLIENFFNL
jgi:hypothetical protein